MKRSHQILGTEKSELQEFLRSLRARSESDAFELFQRLRSEADPFSVLKLIKNGDLLLQALSRQPSDHGSPSNHSTTLSEHRKTNAPRPTETRALAPSGVGEKNVEPNAVSIVPLKRKHATLQSGMDQMLELYCYIHSMSEAEVARIVQRIRLCDDPISVLNFVRNDDPIYQQTLAYPGDEEDQIRLRSLDAAALSYSRI